MKTPKNVAPVEDESPNGGDKFTWKPGEVVWTVKPTSAQKLAGIQKASEGPTRKNR